MTRLRESTKNAEQVTWPAVKEALADSATPIVIDKLARSKQVRSNIRFVVEATIQQIAAAGLLRTPADADVIGKAVEWHESWPDGVDELDDPEDQNLFGSVTKMLEETKDWPRADRA